MSADPSRTAQAIGLVLAALTCFAAMDTAVRYLGGTVPVLMLLILRYLAQALLMLPVLLLSRQPPRTGAAAGRWARGWQPFHSARPGFQLLRGLLLLACSAITFAGLRVMPVAEYTAIAMLTPVLVTLLSVLLFHERISALRWALVIGAFAGALIIIRPGSGVFGWVVLWPLAGSCAYAAFQLVTARFAARENPLVTHFWTGAIGALLVLPAWPLGWVAVGETWRALPGLSQALIALIGLLGTVGHLLLILAFRRSEASRITPFLYAQIAIAVLLGWLALGHVPDGWAWLGMAVIAACGAATAWLNLRAAAAR